MADPAAQASLASVSSSVFLAVERFSSSARLFHLRQGHADQLSQVRRGCGQVQGASRAALRHGQTR